MLTIDQFNDKIADANQTMFDGTFDKFPGLFKLKKSDTRIDLYNDLGVIRFSVNFDTEFAVLKVFVKFETYKVLDEAHKDEFLSIVEMFKD